MPDIDLAAIKERVACPSARQAVQIGEYEACARAIVEQDAPALLAEVKRLIDQRADYYLRACDAEKERDEAEAGADRLRGLLAEAEQENNRLRGLIADALSDRDRANQRIADLTVNLSESLAPELLRQKAEAWDEGYDECEAPHFIDRHNPYRGQQ